MILLVIIMILIKWNGGLKMKLIFLLRLLTRDVTKRIYEKDYFKKMNFYIKTFLVYLFFQHLSTTKQ